MCTLRSRPIGSVLLASFLLFAVGTTAGCDENKKMVAVDSNHVAIRGYDTVAYFTDGKATKGSPKFESVWDEAKWQFASAAHRDMFTANPELYVPQYGGNCAAAMANGVATPADPEAWTIVDGKLYMLRGKAGVGPWKVDADANIQSADKRWLAMQAQQ
jgi:hypothetical protein